MELQRILAMLKKKDGNFAALPISGFVSCSLKSPHGPGQSHSYLDKAQVRISGRNEIFWARVMEPPLRIS
jgi:hypothetical protein